MVGVGAALDHQLDEFGMAFPRSVENRRLLEEVLFVDVGSLFEEELEELDVAIAGNVKKRRLAELIDGVDLGAGIEQFGAEREGL